jgi:hypothetical protein
MWEVVEGSLPPRLLLPLLLLMIAFVWVDKGGGCCPALVE